MFTPRRGFSLARAAETTAATLAACSEAPVAATVRPRATPASVTTARRSAAPATARSFSATIAQRSRLGRTPIPIPQGVELLLSDLQVKKDPRSYKTTQERTLTVQGPLDLVVPSFIRLDLEVEARRVTLSIEDREAQQQKAMWGTTWAHIHQYILGVSEGHTAVLRLVGIGYRATVEERPEKEEYPGQKFVVLKLGFNHPVEMGVPQGVTASAPQPTRILLEGINLLDIMTFAAAMRKWRKPEPYKGKGIFINDETIALKQKKVK